MAETRMKMAAIDPVWQRIGEEAVEAIRSEPLLGGLDPRQFWQIHRGTTVNVKAIAAAELAQMDTADLAATLVRNATADTDGEPVILSQEGGLYYLERTTED